MNIIFVRATPISSRKVYMPVSIVFAMFTPLHSVIEKGELEHEKYLHLLSHSEGKGQLRFIFRVVQHFYRICKAKG